MHHILYNSRQTPGTSKTPYHQQLGRTLIFVRSELVEPVLSLIGPTRNSFRLKGTAAVAWGEESGIKRGRINQKIVHGS